MKPSTISKQLVKMFNGCNKLSAIKAICEVILVEGDSVTIKSADGMSNYKLTSVQNNGKYYIEVDTQ